ncbi:TPA: hypothetical protein GFX78_07150 [Escherichia coli]|nr:hypothetical protein [Escherichia coli]
MPPISDEEKPFELPEGWEWSYLQDVTNLITDGKHGDCLNHDNSGYYFLSAKDIKDGKLSYEHARQIDKSQFEEVHQRTDLKEGDICLVNTGATIGKLALVENAELARRTTFQKSVAIIKPTRPYILNLYLYLYLESQSESLKKKSGGSAINNLLLGDLKKKLLSIPPLNEQQKIVDNVRLLESTLNIIKVKLQSAQQTQLHLADALTDAAIN